MTRHFEFPLWSTFSWFDRSFNYRSVKSFHSLWRSGIAFPVPSILSALSFFSWVRPVSQQKRTRSDRFWHFPVSTSHFVVSLLFNSQTFFILLHYHPLGRQYVISLYSQSVRRTSTCSTIDILQTATSPRLSRCLSFLLSRIPRSCLFGTSCILSFHSVSDNFEQLVWCPQWYWRRSLLPDFVLSPWP